MPAIYALSCTTCDNTKTVGSLRNLSVVLDDGRCEPLPHPGEDRTALHLTGRSLTQLRKDGQVKSQEPFVCGRCLLISYELIGSLPTTCRQCGCEEIHAVGDFLKASDSPLKCLKCREGSFVLREIGRA